MRLAVQRGCRYYRDAVHGEVLDPGTNTISNEELSIGLLHGGQEWSPVLIRMGAAMLGARGNDPKRLARLARLERSEVVVREIAKAGNITEPDNTLWSFLLRELPVRGSIPEGVLPHPTRFVAMTAITREGRGVQSRWIRPEPTHE